MFREPAVAGTFYPASAESLSAMLGGFVDKKKKSEKAIGVVSPHAGYMYSGAVAGAVFSEVEVPATALILAPAHRASANNFALFPEGAWATPLGEVEIDRVIVKKMERHSKFAVIDADAHTYEHSAEVQVPFLQHVRSDIKIVPVVISTLNIQQLRLFGEELADVVTQAGADVLCVASSDMTHYETRQSAGRKDKLAIDEILKLDEFALLETVRKNDISMCGVAPTIAMLAYAKKMGAKEARLVRYATSGETTGDMNEVVGYAGIVVK